jgi:Skp family chaperone for outer membrane proteins
MFQRRQAELTQPVYEKIIKFLDVFCQQRGIVIVLEAGTAYQERMLVWNAPSTDLTEEFMKEYNKANPKKP